MRTLFLTCFIALCSLTASAQVDAKLNVGSAIFGGLGLAADFALSEKSSVSAGVGYASNNFASTTSTTATSGSSPSTATTSTPAKVPTAFS